MIIAALSGALGVLMGAWFSHAERFDKPIIAVLTTALNYQFIHTLALVLVAAMLRQANDKWLILSGSFFIAGLLGFSGAIYFKNIFNWLFISPVTPLGGLCFVAGWLMLAFVGRKKL
jgi:uncharacterized membrane protein YgdD (TMEM256/DUF423 family)